MVLGRSLMVLGLVAATSAAMAGGTEKRAWVSPPAETDARLVDAAGADPAQKGGAAGQTLAAAPWPDEAVRRRAPVAAVALAPPVEREARPLDAVAERQPVETMEGSARQDQISEQRLPDATQSATAFVPAPVSRRTARRLGPLAGFAGAAAARDGAPVRGGPGPEATGREDRQIQGAVGRMRIMQFRNRRVVVIYTRS